MVLRLGAWSMDLRHGAWSMDLRHGPEALDLEHWPWSTGPGALALVLLALVLLALVVQHVGRQGGCTQGGMREEVMPGTKRCTNDYPLNHESEPDYLAFGSSYTRAG